MEKARQISVAHLTPLARELVDLIGLRETLLLVERYGGRTLQVAKGRRQRGREQLDELAGVIGEHAARTLSRRYGGDFLRVPKCADALRATRDAELQARFDCLTGGGSSARAAVALLVAEFGLVESSIWRCLKRPAGGQAIVARVADASQKDLFGAEYAE